MDLLKKEESIMDSGDQNKNSKDPSPELWSEMVTDGVKYLFKNIWKFISSLLKIYGNLYHL